jgi:hypothetical protein
MNLLAIPGCLRSNTCIHHLIAIVSKHTFLVTASKRKTLQFLACIESIVDLRKSTLTYDSKGNLTWQTNKGKCTVNTGEGEANVTAYFILNVKLSNMMGAPFNPFGWAYWRTMATTSDKHNDVAINFIGGQLQLTWRYNNFS